MTIPLVTARRRDERSRVDVGASLHDIANISVLRRSAAVARSLLFHSAHAHRGEPLGVHVHREKPLERHDPKQNLSSSPAGHVPAHCLHV